MRIPSAPGSTQRARHLRSTQTDAEARLWSRLRRHQLDDAHFRRQMPVGSYVCDFVCTARRLIVEVDGEQHAFDTVRDDARTAYLESFGFQVLRFWNPDVLRITDDVVATIYAALVERRRLKQA